VTDPAGHLRAPQCLGRRSLLLGGGAALLLPGQVAAKRGASTLGLADTTVRKELARDYAGTLRAVTSMISVERLSIQLWPQAAQLMARPSPDRRWSGKL